MTDIFNTIGKRFLLLLSVVCMMIVSPCADAQELHPYHNLDPGGYHFWIYSPPGKTSSTNSTRTWRKKDQKPLVVFLHGASLCGNNLSRVRTYGCLDALARGREIDAYVLAPQCSGGGWKPEKVMKLVDWATRTHDIDTTRIYVLGMSMGGYGTIDVAATYPNRFAAAMAICGGGNVRELGNLNKLPLWILHGTADRAVPISASDHVVAEMRKAGRADRLIYTRLKGYNHGQPARIFYLKETYDWLLSHSTKDPGRPVNRDYSITTVNIPRAYKDLHARMPMKVFDRSKVKAVAHAVAQPQQAEEVKSGSEKVESVKRSAPETQEYEVKKGDNLYQIARKNHLTVDELKKLNNLKSDNLSLGQKLKVK